MGDYVLKPFEAADLKRMNLRGYEEHEFGFMGGIDAFARAYENGPAFTLLYKDKVVGCAGVMVLWPGVGEGWFRGSPLIYEHKEKVIEASVAGFKMIKDNGFHRIQAVVLKGWGAANRYVKTLGFEFEGEMRMYGPDKRDFLRYALVDQETE